MNLTLKPFSPLDDKVEWEVLQVIGEGENGFINDGYGLTFDQFEGYILKHLKMSNNVDLPAHLVPQTAYWLMKDEKPVGYGKVRHYLNDNLLKRGGHIGYCIAPEYRGKGYGMKLLSLLLEKAKFLGTDSVLITCNDTKIASQKVITGNVGMLWKTDDENHWSWIYM